MSPSANTGVEVVDLDVGHVTDKDDSIFIDCKDLVIKDPTPDESGCLNSSRKAIHESIVKQTVENIEKTRGPLCTLGGDHYITYPVFEALKHKHPNDDIHIVHFDAHSDLYALFDGNPFSHASPFARIMEGKLAKSLTQIGLRTLTDHQRDQIAKHNVKGFEMKDLEDKSDLYQHLKGLANGKNDKVYISIDLDVLDPAFAPGVSHYEPGGMTTREVMNCIHKLVHKRLIGGDVVEYNPNRDTNAVTAMVAAKFVKEIGAIMFKACNDVPFQ
mmetsp:Transcript_20286/g.22552  ORF Transcript_20286/g.22552 Transcript_20286/m.22552 type:complete len:272 (-) Transcript_20286:17-832(-)